MVLFFLCSLHLLNVVYLLELKGKVPLSFEDYVLRCDWQNKLGSLGMAWLLSRAAFCLGMGSWSLPDVFWTSEEKILSALSQEEGWNPNVNGMDVCCCLGKIVVYLNTRLTWAYSFLSLICEDENVTYIHLHISMSALFCVQEIK